jgi:hypothetical protein
MQILLPAKPPRKQYHNKLQIYTPKLSFHHLPFKEEMPKKKKGTKSNIPNKFP